MVTRLSLDDELVTRVQKLGGFAAKRDAVHGALVEYIQRRRQARIIDLFGRIDIDVRYRHKAGRE